MNKKQFWILFATMISGSAYALIAPFLPLVFAEKHIPSETTGFIFAVYSVAVIICSPFVATTIPTVGEVNLMSGGIVLMGTC